MEFITKIKILSITFEEREGREKGSKDRTARSREQCRKTTVLSCHRCLINTGVEEMNSI
jgi:hypothetical protein